MKSAVTIACLTAAVLAIYAYALGGTLYLHYDEVYFAIQAQSIATTGRDISGRLLPFYFEATSGSWFQPAVVYLTALFLQVLPLSDAALRLPTVFIALLDVLFIYLIAKRIFDSDAWGIVAAVVLMLTPAHVIFGRLAVSYLYPVCALLAWLYCLMIFLERRRPLLLFVATTCLGLGFFTYIAATAMMPLYLAMTCIALWVSFDRPWKLLAIAVVGFAWPLLLSVPFHLAHPDVMLQKLGTYGPSGVGHALDPLQHTSELLTYNNLSYRVSLFFSFFNPGYLFMSGAGNPVNSTRRAGVFLMSLAVFIPVGIYRALRDRWSLVDVMVVAGFLTAPLAAILVAESEATDRELEVLPFGVLLAVYGIRYLWSAPLAVRLRGLTLPIGMAGAMTGVTYAAWTLIGRGSISRTTPLLVLVSIAIIVVGRAADATRQWRPIVATLLLLGVVQFQSFYRDYLTEYPSRSAEWFMSNRRGAFEKIFNKQARDRPAKVLISNNILYADSYWRLYTSMFHRDDLRSAMSFFDPAAVKPADVPDGAFVLVTTPELPRLMNALAPAAGLTTVSTIPEPDGVSVYVVLQKAAAAANF